MEWSADLAKCNKCPQKWELTRKGWNPLPIDEDNYRQEDPYQKFKIDKPAMITKRAKGTRRRVVKASL